MIKKVGKRTLAWRKFRKAYLEKYKNGWGWWNCWNCGTPLDHPDVHHIKGRGSHPHLVYEESNLVILCRPCHQRRHKQL